jgi:hypothetical protein
MLLMIGYVEFVGVYQNDSGDYKVQKGKAVMIDAFSVKIFLAAACTGPTEETQSSQMN